jgi:hypothetical protein
LPSGASGCVSTYLAHLAPLTGANAKYYVGVAWINGHRVSEVINPRSGNPWAQVPGALGGADQGSSVFVGPNATLSSSSAAIQIDNLSLLGIVGDPVSFSSSAGNILAHHPYWILSKSGTTGSGTITIA